MDYGMNGECGDGEVGDANFVAFLFEIFLNFGPSVWRGVPAMYENEIHDELGAVTVH
jgi:hypothetical protein